MGVVWRCFLSPSSKCDVLDLCHSDDEDTLLPFLFDQSCATLKKYKFSFFCFYSHVHS